MPPAAGARQAIAGAFALCGGRPGKGRPAQSAETEDRYYYNTRVRAYLVGLVGP